MSDLELAEALAREILGRRRMAMSCGCVMGIQDMLDVSVQPYKPYRRLSFPRIRCQEHAVNCPYINQRLNE